jgi:glycerol-3-phosphate acyltransferase PlsY
MLELGVKTLIAYLVGALLGSLLLGRSRGIDVRTLGSGNAGATNALRTQGRLFGFLVLCIDIGKGLLVVWWLPTALLPGIAADPGVSREWLTLACALAVIVGHVYPVWYGFRGGKGFATVIGVIAALDLKLVAALVLCWLAVLLLTGYVGLATMLAGIALILAARFIEPDNLPLLGFCAVLAALLVFTHRGNIVRMWTGNENRVRRLWLFRSRTI